MLIDKDSFNYAVNLIFPERTEKFKKELENILLEEIDISRYKLSNIRFDNNKIEIFYSNEERNIHWFKNSSYLLYELKDLECAALKFYITDSSDIDLSKINIEYIENKLKNIFGNITSLTKFI